MGDAVARQERMKPRRPPPPHTEPPTMRAVVLPSEEGPWKWTPPDSPPSSFRTGPAKAVDTAKMSLEFPEQSFPTFWRQFSDVPEELK